MSISIEQAIEIHAKAAISRSGKRAEIQTRERARHCEALGDLKGSETWTKVANGIRQLEEQGYRLVANNGAGGGQVVFHFHVHIVSGKTPPGFGRVHA